MERNLKIRVRVRELDQEVRIKEIVIYRNQEITHPETCPNGKLFKKRKLINLWKFNSNLDMTREYFHSQLIVPIITTDNPHQPRVIIIWLDKTVTVSNHPSNNQIIHNSVQTLTTSKTQT